MSFAENAKAKLGEPKDVKVAIPPDGPTGSAWLSQRRFGKEKGLQLVLREGYSATAPDLSSLVTKLKRAGADVISHCGYNPDITLFLRQARESGLRFKMLVGNGAGYSQLDKLRATFGKDIDNFCNIDPVPAQLLNPASLAPGLGDLIKTMVERYKAKTNATDAAALLDGLNQTWVLLNNAAGRQRNTAASTRRRCARPRSTSISPGRHHSGLRREIYRPARSSPDRTSARRRS